jgi:fatty acid desaturase
MADLSADHPADASVPPEEMREHLRSYISFERLVLFAVLHVALALACLALAFMADVPMLAFLFFLAGSLTIIASFVIHGSSNGV